MPAFAIVSAFAGISSLVVAEGYRPPRDVIFEPADHRSIQDKDIALAGIALVYLNFPMLFYIPTPYIAYRYWTAPPPEPLPDIATSIAPVPAPETMPEVTPEIATEAAIDSAVEAATAPARDVRPVPRPSTNAPPLTRGEKDALRVAVQTCWNVGALTAEALRVTVHLGLTLGKDGRPDLGSIQLIAYEGGSDAAANEAFRAARRAIIRCGADGYDLPIAKYELWRAIEMTFNSERMRIK